MQVYTRVQCYIGGHRDTQVYTSIHMGIHAGIHKDVLLYRGT